MGWYIDSAGSFKNPPIMHSETASTSAAVTEREALTHISRRGDACVSPTIASAIYRWSATLSPSAFSAGYWLDVPKSQTSGSQVA